MSGESRMLFYDERKKIIEHINDIWDFYEIVRIINDFNDAVVLEAAYTRMMYIISRWTTNDTQSFKISAPPERISYSYLMNPLCSVMLSKKIVPDDNLLEMMIRYVDDMDLLKKLSECYDSDIIYKKIKELEDNKNVASDIYSSSHKK